MVKIHTAGDGHSPPTGRHKWQPFTDKTKIKVVQDALFILEHNIKGSKPCNKCFQALSGGRTFDDVLADASVFISFDPSRKDKDYGATIGNDITLTDYTIAMGRWTTAATLVHEMAHVNGTSGETADAENTLICCNLKRLHNPNIIGTNDQTSGSRFA